MSHDIEQHTPALAPTRRTVLTGAAWSVPVIAAASLAPVASASGVTALTFNQSSYGGTACGTISGAYVTVTVDGVAAAGKSVTTTLSGGYTFAGGATTDTQVSGSDGRVSLPAINVPSAGGTGTLYSSSASSSASASATAPVSGKNGRFLEPSGATTSFAFPAGTIAVGLDTFLTPTGDLYLADSKLASNVVTASGTAEAAIGWWVTYLRADGTGAFVEPNGTTNSRTLPAGTKVVGLDTFLTPNGDLYANLNGNPSAMASNVVSAHGDAQNGIGWWVTYLRADGSGAFIEPGGTINTRTLPAGTKVVGTDTYLTSNGDLYANLNANPNPAATNVASAHSHTEANVGWWVTYVRGNGSGGLIVPDGTVKSRTLPTGTKVAGLDTFLTPSGDLYVDLNANPNAMATNVTSADGHAQNGIGWWVSYVINASC